MLSKHLCKEIVKHCLTFISNERVYDYTLKKKYIFGILSIKF